MKGVAGLEGWSWIFIIAGDTHHALLASSNTQQEGIVTCVIAVGGYRFIEDWPSKSKFLSAEDKSLLISRLKADSDAVNTEHFVWAEVFKAFKDPKVWLYCVAFHTLSLPLYILSLFLVS